MLLYQPVTAGMCLQCAKKLTAAQMSHAKSSISTFQKHSFWKFNFPIILRDLQTCFEIGEGNTHVSWCKKLIRKVSFQLFYVKVAPKCADLWWYQSDKSETRKEIFWNGAHCRKSKFSGTGKYTYWQLYLIQYLILRLGLEPSNIYGLTCLSEERTLLRSRGG